MVYTKKVGISFKILNELNKTCKSIVSHRNNIIIYLYYKMENGKNYMMLTYQFHSGHNQY